MQITGKTKIVGIFGDPIAHSLSPVMQNAAIKAGGIDAVYVPFHVLPENLGPAVASIRTLGLIGVNVTVPHKEMVIPFLDEIDPAAELVGAVNTIVNRAGRLIGFNTDGEGLIRGLEEDLSFSVPTKKIIVLGAGGAARAAIVALAGSAAAEITIINRSLDKAERLVSDFSVKFPGTKITALPLEEPVVTPVLAAADLLLNTTVVGLAGESFDFELIERLSKNASFYDMVYAPEPTPLQQFAQQCGIDYADGRGMLAGQGEVAFSHWFGRLLPPGTMKLYLQKYANIINTLS